VISLAIDYLGFCGHRVHCYRETNGLFTDLLLEKALKSDFATSDIAFLS
jgi:hypothetical protein